MRPQADRDRKAPLSRDQIVRAAIALADVQGLEALSMRRLAASLQSGATSLYWHVADLFGHAALDDALVISVLGAVNNYVMGFGHRETAWMQMIRRSGLTPDEWGERFRTYLDQVVRGTDPELARRLEARLDLRGEAEFEFGLQCLLDGIAARLPAPSS